MKITKLFDLLIIASLLALIGCDELITDYDSDNKNTIHGSGRLISIEENFADFNELEISHTFNATVKKGSLYSVKLEINDNLKQYLISEKRGSRVYLGLQGNNNYNNITLRAEITLPSLNSLIGSGATAFDVSGFKTDGNFNIDLSGASYVKGNFETGNLNIDLSGASLVELTGKGKNLSIEASGASGIKLINFESTGATIDASGASYADLFVNGVLNAELTGASVLKYKGNTTLGRISSTGTSSIIRIQ